MQKLLLKTMSTFKTIIFRDAKLDFPVKDVGKAVVTQKCIRHQREGKEFHITVKHAN